MYTIRIVVAALHATRYKTLYAVYTAVAFAGLQHARQICDGRYRWDLAHECVNVGGGVHYW